MSTTIVRVRRTVAPGGFPILTFAIDGLPTDDQLLDLDPAVPPIDALLAFQSTPDHDSDVIENAGLAIHDRLARHTNAQSALTATLNSPIGETSREIRIQIETIAKVAHDLPWETLWMPGQGFVALSQDLPFSRIVPPVNADNVRPTGTFDGTLKMVVILAAAGVPASAQWRAIEQASTQWPADKFECLLFVDTPQLKQQIEADIGGRPGFTVKLVPLAVDDLVKAIGDFAPHIIHLFCHGQSDAGGVLEIATPNSALGQPPLFLRPNPLASAARSSWLVILNACSTGETDPEANTNSMACTLVELGVPFVTSMRQRIAATVADKFAKAFLGRFLHDLAEDFETGAAFKPRVAGAVMAARRQIMDALQPAPLFQRRYKEWTLPILCTSIAPFELRPVSKITEQKAAETLAAIRMLQSLLDSGTADDDKTRKIEARLTQLEQSIE